MHYSEQAVDELIKNYRDEFGVHISFEDAIRMIVLVDMLAEVFERYEDECGEDMPSFFSLLLGF